MCPFVCIPREYKKKFIHVKKSGGKIKRNFLPRKMKFHLIGKVMMCSVGQAGSDSNDASHLTYLLAFTGLPSAILWLT